MARAARRQAVTRDAQRWRRLGSQLHAAESVCGAPHATTCEAARTVVRLALVVALAEVPESRREAAVALAAEGYLAERPSSRGTPTDV